VSAWVFGNQLFDVLGLLLHPAAFYSWLYVITLSQVKSQAHSVAHFMKNSSTEVEHNNKASKRVRATNP
jgi:hypothetical protein